MTFQKLTDSEKATQVLPEKKQLPLQGLYLDQRLAGMFAKIGQALVIAKADEHHHFQVPLEIKNTFDWGLSQELMAQADVIIRAGSYLKRISVSGSHAQDILYQFESGGKFDKLGEW